MPKAKGTTKTALQASAVPVATAHELKALIRAEGLPKVNSSKKAVVAAVLREHWGLR